MNPLTISDINVPVSTFPQNLTTMVGYETGDNSIIYTSGDNHLRKYVVDSGTVVQSAVAAGQLNAGGSTKVAISGTDLVLFDPGVFAIFTRWNAIALTLTNDYWPVFSGVAQTLRSSNIVFSQSLDSMWAVEGSGSPPYSLVRYRLTAGTRTVVSGISIGAARLSLDAKNGRVFYSDGTNLGVASTDTDSNLSSVAWSTIATCGAGFNNFDVDPEGFIWATCQGNNFSGHLWKIDPVTLTALGVVGHHNNFLNIHVDASGIPVGVNNFAFGSFPLFEVTPTQTVIGHGTNLQDNTTKLVLVAGNGFWEGALVDRDEVAIKWNTGTSPRLLLNGSDLFANNLGTCGIAASDRTFWSLANDGGSSSALAITRIQATVSAAPPGNGTLIKDLSALHNWARANGISVALCQDSQRTAKDLLDELLTVGNSAPVYSGDELKIIPYDEVSNVDNGAVYISPTASGPVADLTDKDFASDGKTAPVKFTRKRRAICDNVVALEHIDRSMDYVHNVTTEADTVHVAQYGPRKGGTLDGAELGVNNPSGSKSLLSIHSAEVAQAIASILAKRSAAGLNEYSFTLKAEWLALEAMDLVTLTDTRLGLNKVPVRLTSTKETSNRELECTAEAFVYGLNHPDVKATTGVAPSLVTVNADPGLVNTPLIFEPPAGMLAAGSVPQIWVVVSGADPNYGGCVCFVSLDGGVTYNAIGTISPGTGGVLTSTFPSHADPDTVDTLAVDLSESNGVLTSQPTAIADLFEDPCFVESASGFEAVCPTVATLTSAGHYSLGTYIRRGVGGTTVASHASGKRFAVLDGATFKIDLPANWVGLTIHLKFAAFNKTGGQQNDLSACVDYTFTPVGVFMPGGFYVNGS